MKEYIINRESLKRHCEAMCHKFKDVLTSGAYGKHRLVLDLLEQTEWIPVSERLPEENTAVLIWCPERKNIYCAYLEEKQWWIFGAYFQKVPLEVIAWMPLPKPYKP